ncbi:BPSL0067 family protein [Duganella dendranthematis]
MSSRFIPCRGKTKNGAYMRASDNADAFYVIE